MKPLHLLLCAALATAPVGVAAAETVWFEVASNQSDVSQSFLLSLNDPAQIALARKRLRDGAVSGVGSIVVARARGGGDGLNRNLRAPGQPLWSWHVAELLEFADLSIELCDGSPQLVQDDPAGFLANTGGVICFWGYSLVAELTAPPRIALTDALDGFWHDPQAAGTGFAIDVLEDQQALGMAWFRYAPEAAAAPVQQWLIGLAALPSADADGWIILHPEVPSSLPSTLTAAAAALTAQSIRLRFLDCNQAEVAPDHPLSGTQRLVRTAEKRDCSGR